LLLTSSSSLSSNALFLLLGTNGSFGPQAMHYRWSRLDSTGRLCSSQLFWAAHCSSSTERGNWHAHLQVL
jgi:hypothetical protein